jgi:acetyltransferase-like isoleucine patch superfamily enzyme
MSNSLAPVVLFVYNRPSHTEQTLEALLENDLANQSLLYIYADGPKNFLPETVHKINEVRQIIRKKKWCREVVIFESDFNKGLADSIVNGVTEIINKYGKIIVLEDDIITSRGFLKYMNDALTCFENEEAVMHISGYMYPHTIKAEREIVFLRVLSCWGWATWQRAWKNYSNNLDEFLSKLKTREEINRFNIRGNATFFDQLKANHTGRMYTWAVRWYASWFFKNGYSVFPTTSLVQNIGHDGSGVHCTSSNLYDSGRLAESISVSRQPITENDLFLNLINAFYKNEKSLIIDKKSSNKGLFKWIKYWLYQKVATIIHKMLGVHKRFYRKQLSVNAGNICIDSFISDHAKVYDPHKLEESFIGDYSYVAQGSYLSKVQVGKFCSLGPNIFAGYGIHPVNGLSTSPMFYSNLRQNGSTFSFVNRVVERRPIKIGNDVFIGANVTILDGVTIGDGAVIGAGAVVSKDIPPYAIAVGCPIKVIRYRFDGQIIDELLRIKWWNWSVEKLKLVEEEFYDIKEFIGKAKSL